MQPVIEKLVSGGQSGADIAALDVALAHGLPHGGWCPLGRKSEEGPIPERYRLTETPKANYLQRNEWNVRDSDGTVVLTMARQVSGGSLRTLEFAEKLSKPVYHLSRQEFHDVPKALRLFVEEQGIKTLNIAGSSESREPGIHAWAMEVLEGAFFGFQ